MKITVNKRVFNRFPKFRVAFILVENIKGSKNKEVDHLLQEIKKIVRLSFNKDTVKTHQLISPWTVAQQEFGKKARHYQTSAEKLIKRVLQNKSIVAKHSLVNILKYLSLKYIVPFGVDDLDKVQGNIKFSLAAGKEKIKIVSKVKKGDLVYADKKGLLGAKLDYWKSPRTKLGKKTERALVHIDALPPISNKQLKDYVEETKGLINSFYGAKTKAFILSKKKNEIKI